MPEILEFQLARHSTSNLVEHIELDTSTFHPADWIPTDTANRVCKITDADAATRIYLEPAAAAA